MIGPTNRLLSRAEEAQRRAAQARLGTAADLDQGERAALAVLEQGAMSPGEFAAVITKAYPARGVAAGEELTALAARGRDARAVMLRLQALGLADMDGTNWRVTSHGRQVALTMLAVPIPAAE